MENILIPTTCHLTEIRTEILSRPQDILIYRIHRQWGWKIVGALYISKCNYLLLLYLLMDQIRPKMENYFHIEAETTQSISFSLDRVHNILLSFCLMNWLKTVKTLFSSVYNVAIYVSCSSKLHLVTLTQNLPTRTR